MKILITGGAGFAGSNLAILLKNKYPQYEILCIDNLKRRGSELNLARLKEFGINFLHADIRNPEDLEGIEAFDFLIDAAAEPSVLAGIQSPVAQVLHNNFLGTFHCLELAKKYNAGFVFLSTSRVYPIAALENIAFQEDESRFSFSENQTLPGVSSKGIAENFTLEGSRSFYGTTKLASELLIKEYQDLLGMKVIINRCGVLTGEWQMGKVDQGVVVLWLARHYWKGKLGYFGYGGEGKQLRDVLHIKDLFRLVDLQIHQINKFNGKVFNVGGGNEVSISLKELTAICQEITGNIIPIEKVKENRTADIRMYVTDNQSITDFCGWKPEIAPKEILRDIFNWLKTNEHQLKSILN